ncbi:MAG: hypothetical protein ACYDBQ_08290 [Thermoplasmatota archaeon]
MPTAGPGTNACSDWPEDASWAPNDTTFPEHTFRETFACAQAHFGPGIHLTWASAWVDKEGRSGWWDLGVVRGATAWHYISSSIPPLPPTTAGPMDEMEHGEAAPFPPLSDSVADPQGIQGNVSGALFLENINGTDTWVVGNDASRAFNAETLQPVPVPAPLRFRDALSFGDAAARSWRADATLAFAGARIDPLASDCYFVWDGGLAALGSSIPGWPPPMGRGARSPAWFFQYDSGRSWRTLAVGWPGTIVLASGDDAAPLTSTHTTWIDPARLDISHLDGNVHEPPDSFCLDVSKGQWSVPWHEEDIVSSNVYDARTGAPIH